MCKPRFQFGLLIEQKQRINLRNRNYTINALIIVTIKIKAKGITKSTMFTSIHTPQHNSPTTYNNTKILTESEHEQSEAAKHSMKQDNAGSPDVVGMQMSHSHCESFLSRECTRRLQKNNKIWTNQQHVGD